MNLWVIAGGIALLFGLLVWSLSPAPSSETYTLRGVLADSSIYQDFPIKGKGQKTNVNLRFDVGQQTFITMPRRKGDPDPKPGMKVKIFYKLGRVFQNKVYLDYEWIH